MIIDLVKKNELQEHVKAWQTLVSRVYNGLCSGNDPVVMAAAAKYGWKLEQVKLFDTFLGNAAAGLCNNEDVVYIASSEELSLLQTIMESAYIKAGFVESTSDGQGISLSKVGVCTSKLKEEIKPSSAQSLFYSNFDDPNPLFITEGIKALFHRLKIGKHAFSDNPPTVALAKRARVILVGDWGSGIERAQKLAGQMAAQVMPDRECHFVHLGDIYFCGWPEEVQERFLTHWPVKAGTTNVHSWCLNGNHDMYSGGHGYFEVVLRDSRFLKQGGCSYFALENDQWQILGLDTAYEEWTLSGNQLAWAIQKRRDSPSKKSILLSHHQPYSDYERDDSGHKSTRLLQKLAPLLGGQTTAWLWGHEHRAVVYSKPKLSLGNGASGQLTLGACLGNGGVPTRPTKVPKNATSEYVETGHSRVGMERFGLFGFAVLDLDGDQANLTIHNEQGGKAGPFRIG